MRRLTRAKAGLAAVGAITLMVASPPRPPEPTTRRVPAT